MTTKDLVYDALSGVYDPELDQSVTELGFVGAVTVSGSEVEVSLRLPTYFCAPNFSYLMATDTRQAIEALPGITHARVRVLDHFASKEIEQALEGKGLDQAFGPQSGESLDALRELFVRKAFLARQGKLAQLLLDLGHTVSALEQLSVKQLPACLQTERYLARRAELAIDCSQDAPAFVMPNGDLIEPGGLERQLRYARMVRLSVEANAGFCRSVLAARYPEKDFEEVKT